MSVPGCRARRRTSPVFRLPAGGEDATASGAIVSPTVPGLKITSGRGVSPRDASLPPGGCPRELTIRADGNDTHLVADVFFRSFDTQRLGIPPVLSADVNLNGFLTGGRDVVSATKLATGKYRVTFGRNLSLCQRVAALGFTSNSAQNENFFNGESGEIHTFNTLNVANSVVVTTRNSAGALADRSFHLIITCRN